MPGKIRILHIITDTDIGGAERMLEKLLHYTDRSRFEPEVFSLLPIQSVGKSIQDLGIPVATADMGTGLPSLSQIIKVYKWVKERKPAVVQTWMYHADLIGGIAARLAGVPVIWGIHQSNLDPSVNSRNTLLSARIARRISHWLPYSIVCCSDASSKAHTAYGYEREKMHVIHNGFEIPASSPSVGRALRDELEIDHNAFVIGMVARYDRQKDHSTFIHAARLLFRSHRDVIFLLCGEDVEWKNSELKALIEREDDEGFPGAFHLIGRRSDMEEVYAAMDILGTSSVGEGLPMVVGEAMARSIPCVVTDVGDSAYVVGNTGIVVPPSSPEKLSLAWESMYELNKDELAEKGKAALNRIEEVLHIRKTSEKYHALYVQAYEEAY